ncbi:MAG: phosphoglucosamine mutase [Endomicrobium sp.]|jgi:phosphoglucosamine mutase|nr:phosphoglucosamine mutase [Endomicrobium sp.]
MKYFGTDGIRGDAKKFPFDDNTLLAVGKAVGAKLGKKDKPFLIIRDTRQSGERIQKLLAQGLNLSGVKVVFGGVMPTSAAAFLTRQRSRGKGIAQERFCGAAVISASHNPYQDNGVKIFNYRGLKLTDKTQNLIEKKISQYGAKSIRPNKTLSAKKNDALIKEYENFVVENFRAGNLNGKKIVLDCANGAAFKCAPKVLKKLGASVALLNVKPNGKNINKNCGALHPEIAAKAVKKHKAFCGFAFDGDADRLICIDENGQIKDGDYFLYSMAAHLKRNGKLKNNVLVATVMSNIGLFKAAKKEKIKVITSQVGDRYVLEDLKKHKASLGGEQSGHFIFKDVLDTGDGLLSAVMILSALNDTGKKMSEFFNGLEKFPQVLINKKVSQKIPIEKLKNVSRLIKIYERKLDGDGRILARYSGTENLLRIMVEGKDKKEITDIANEIINLADREINDQIGS